MDTAVHRIGQHIRRWKSLEDGQTMAEYGLILAGVFLLAFGAFQLLGPAIQIPIDATAALF